MKIYKTKKGNVIDHEGNLYLSSQTDWDSLVNRAGLFARLQQEVKALKADASLKSAIDTGLLAPISHQEVWASGVTYMRSREARMEESKDAGGGDFYARVYEADRPELFFKATAYRTVGSGEPVRIRKDSKWNVPEPELTLVICSDGSIE
jgi:2-dehydro-3-deoxy-D-arabinonate dehydratase